MNFLYTILDIVFPIKCLICGERGQDLCIKCLSLSPEAERESARWIFPLYDYRHPPIKKAIGFLKYKGKKRIAKVFAEALYARILEEIADLKIMKNFQNPILIPIPLSPKRYRERGYNQTELICKSLIEIDKSNLRHGIDVNFTLKTNILLKIKETEHQAHIKDRKRRLKNLEDSFAIKNTKENIEILKNRSIILIDDVTTTGATLSEAKKILKQNGVKHVIAFTVAH